MYLSREYRPAPARIPSPRSYGWVVHDSVLLRDTQSLQCSLGILGVPIMMTAMGTKLPTIGCSSYSWDEDDVFIHPRRT
ncbi:hypothetical protein BST61_g8823 [Cercospora zeina]